MAKLRDFLSLEQALIYASKDLTDEDLIAIGKTREDIRRFSDPSKKDRQILHRDSIQIDVALAKKDRGTPILKAHEALIDKALAGHNIKAGIMQSLLHTGERLGRLMGVTEKALDPSGPSGSNISKDEKDKIYKSLKEVEEKIASLKKAIE
jgi:hypothetical protein